MATHTNRLHIKQPGIGRLEVTAKDLRWYFYCECLPGSLLLLAEIHHCIALTSTFVAIPHQTHKSSWLRTQAEHVTHLGPHLSTRRRAENFRNSRHLSFQP